MAEKLYTPVATAIHPWLTRPDTKFNADGDYKVTLRIPAEEAQPLIDELQARLDEYVKEETSKLPKGKKLPRVNELGVTPVVDDSGDETGEVDIRGFKTKARITVKGQVIDKKLPIVDSQGKQVVDDIAIFGGSKIRLSFTPAGYNTGTGVGLALRINGVQVIDLVSGSGGGGGGFGAVEGGSFTASSAKSTEADDGDDDDDNF